MRVARWLVVGLLALFVGVCGTAGYGDEVVTLSFVSYFDIGPEATWPASAGHWMMADEFMRRNPDVKLEFSQVAFGELVPQVMRWAMTGELPDFVALDNPDVLHAAAAGVYYDLTPLVKEWGQWEDFYLGVRYALTYKDKIVAFLPGTNNVALYYRKDILNKLGLTPPTTWNELLDVCAKLAQGLEGTGMYPLGVSAINTEELTWQFEPFLWSNGGSLLKLDAPEAVEALKLWVQLFKEGYVPKDALTWGQGADPFIGGQVAMMINGPWILPLVREAGLDYGIVPIPAPREGAKVALPMGGEVLGISANIQPEKVSAAWRYITFFVEPENMAKFCLRAGYVPTRKAAVPMVVSGDPDLEPFAKQAEFALPRPPMGGDELYTEVSAICRKYIQLALAGELAAEEAFGQAAKEIRALFPTDQAYQDAVTKADQLLAEVLGQ